MFTYKIKTYTYLLILMLLTLLSASSSFGESESRDNASTPEIKVAIGLDLMDARIALPGGGKIFDSVKNREELKIDKSSNLNFRYENNGKFSSSELKGLYSDIRIIPNPKSHFKFKGNDYRGYLRIISKPTGIWVINHVDIEEYLYGVVPYEIPMSWNMEAIKAQAVAARTYAVRGLGQYPHGDFDVYDSVKDQVYGGIEGEDERAIQAVEATRGIILTYQGWPILAYYHADAGGQTEDGKYIFPDDDFPYLTSVPSKDNLEKHRWNFTMKKGELESLLKKSKRDVGSVNSIEVREVSPSGRPLTIRITGSKGKIDISSRDFRRMIGSGRIRSTLFAISTHDNESSSLDFSGNIRILSPDLNDGSLRVMSSTGIKNGQEKNISVITSAGISDWDLKSILIISTSRGDVYTPKIEKKLAQDEILFSGSGFGHGVGLSQWGAKAYADDGWDYRQILSHYYREAELSVWY